jgi:GTPase
VDRVIQARAAPEAATLIGQGKVEELSAAVKSTGADVVIFDHDLTPTQQRNLEKAIDAKIIDRTQLILDIFASRARTREGRLQVELAQLNYLLPRLAGRGTEMSRLGGGIGTRGPGETQLESDRRVVRRRIAQIHEALADVQRHRRLLRTHRRDVGLSVVALVGYTNAGKTTLLNRLTGASLTAADQLFVTLDPAARAVSGNGHPPFIVTDTVGFIRKLPHELVAAFRATLEELHEADVLLHVVDASHPARDEQMAAVDGLLHDLDVHARPTILVLNKTDRLDGGPATLATLLADRHAVAVSAVTGEGLDELRSAIASALRPGTQTVTLRIPHGDGAALAVCYERGRVLTRVDADGHVEVQASLPSKVAGTLSPYRVN